MKSENERMKEWVDNWKVKGEILEKMRIEKMRKSNIYQSMLALNDAFEMSIANRLIPKTSGLIEQQFFFMKFKKND